MKIKYKNEDCCLTVKIKCGFGERIALDMIERFSQKEIPFFLKVSSWKSRKATCTGIRAVLLKDYLRKPIGKFEFLFILAQFVRLVKTVEDNNLPLSYISFDLGTCFLTENTKELQLLYLPINSTKIRLLPNDFIESFVYSASPVNGGDYISSFAYFYRNQAGFKTKTIERYIGKEEPRVYQLLDNKPSNIEGERKVRERDFEIKNKHKKENVCDDVTLLGEDNTELADEDCTLIGDESTLLGDLEDTVLEQKLDDETAYLPCSLMSCSPYLKRIATSEIIRLTKSSFRIGVKESEVDYVVKNSNTISRSHADFIIDSGKYFVYDLSSKNKTFVNNRVIQVQTRVQIYHNDVVRLADEDFVFCVE